MTSNVINLNKVANPDAKTIIPAIIRYLENGGYDYAALEGWVGAFVTEYNSMMGRKSQWNNTDLLKAEETNLETIIKDKETEYNNLKARREQIAARIKELGL